MKKLIYIMIALFLLSPVAAFADDFLGAPLPPDGKVISESQSKKEAVYAMSYDEALAFYKEAFKDNMQEMAFRDRGSATYIEEYSNRPWHSVLVTKNDDGTTTITVTRDSYTWIAGTLGLRFFAVFIVLIALYIPLQILSIVMGKVQAKKAAAKAAA